MSTTSEKGAVGGGNDKTNDHRSSREERFRSKCRIGERNVIECSWGKNVP